MQASYRHKLSRARFHIAGLRDAFLADHKAGRFRPDVTKHDAASGTRFQATFRVPEEQMVSYSLMAGDGIQNLRATLDHLAYALAGSRRREGLTQFPICA